MAYASLMSSDHRPQSGSDFLRPPEDLSADPERFYKVDTAREEGLHEEAPSEHPSALDRLGSSPLPKTGFPFIGFMSGVYEHVSAIARGETPIEG